MDHLVVDTSANGQNLPVYFQNKRLKKTVKYYTYMSQRVNIRKLFNQGYLEKLKILLLVYTSRIKR